MKPRIFTVLACLCFAATLKAEEKPEAKPVAEEHKDDKKAEKKEEKPKEEKKDRTSITTLVRNLRPLQRDGLVQINGGGRGNLVELSITSKGRKQFEKLTPAWKAAQCAVVKTLGEKRWSAILSDLETAVSALKI